MFLRLAADVVVLVHFAFILFVVVGGLLVVRWRTLAWFHVPAVLWGALIGFTGWICPLTPLENALRQASGLADYSGGFIDNYIVPIVYPPGLTRPSQITLGVGVVVINCVFYGLVVLRRAGRKRDDA